MEHFDLGALNRLHNMTDMDEDETDSLTQASENFVAKELRHWCDGVLLDAILLEVGHSPKSRELQRLMLDEGKRRHEIRRQTCLKCSHAYSFTFPGGAKDEVVCGNCGLHEPQEKMAAIARAPFRPGDRVRMKTSGETGRVRFLGAIEFATTHMPYHWLVTYIVRMDNGGDMHTDVTSLESAEPVAGSASH